MTFVVGQIVGVALGTIVIAFLALSAYERGYDAASQAPGEQSSEPGKGRRSAGIGPSRP